MLAHHSAAASSHPEILLLAMIMLAMLVALARLKEVI